MSIQRASARRLLAAAVVAAAALAVAGCDNESDPVAPAESVLSVTGNPTTVVVPSAPEVCLSGVQCGVISSCTTVIVATLRSKNGTRLPDQEVTFSSSQGSLTPAAETPLITDEEGQVESCLFTRASATVTARSGGISANESITTAPGELAPILLNITNTSVPGANNHLTACDDDFDLIATVLTTSGQPVPNFQVVFRTTPLSAFVGIFSSTQAVTNSTGKAVVRWTPDTSGTTNCTDKCSGGMLCELFFVASGVNGDFESVEVPIIDDVL